MAPLAQGALTALTHEAHVKRQARQRAPTRRPGAPPRGPTALAASTNEANEENHDTAYVGGHDRALERYLGVRTKLSNVRPKTKTAIGMSCARHCALMQAARLRRLCDNTFARGMANREGACASAQQRTTPCLRRHAHAGPHTQTRANARPRARETSTNAWGMRATTKEQARKNQAQS